MVESKKYKQSKTQKSSFTIINHKEKQQMFDMFVWKMTEKIDRLSK